MPVLSAANAIQAKTGQQANSATATVTLDNPTSPGGTVTVELWGPIVWPGMPDGWEYDASVFSTGLLWVFRYSGGPGGETSWQWTLGFATNWFWRVTEWDTALDPVSPLETFANNTASGTGVTTVSTGTTPTTTRAEVVCLATHVWNRGSNTAQTFNWDSYTNGFVERDELRVTMGLSEFDVAWSWLFADTAGTFETTATVNTTPRNAGDTYYSLILVYAATQPVMVDTPGAILVT
jgi:hypothetical protein